MVSRMGSQKNSIMGHLWAVKWTTLRVYFSVFFAFSSSNIYKRTMSFRLNPSHSDNNIRHLNIRSTSLKLIYIISSIFKLKINHFGYFVPIHQAAQNRRPKVVSLLDLYIWTYKFTVRPFHYDLNI